MTYPKGYQTYARQTVAPAEAVGRFLVKGGAQTISEGDAPEWHVIIEFPDRKTPLDWYNSDAYRCIFPQALSASHRDIVTVDAI